MSGPREPQPSAEELIADLREGRAGPLFLEKVADTLESLLAQNEQLRAEVKEWMCRRCRWVYPGPPQRGLLAVVCPRCGGDCWPMLRAQVEDVKDERDTARAALEALKDSAQKFLSTVADNMDYDFQANEVEQAITEFRAALATTTEKEHRAVSDWGLSGHLKIEGDSGERRSD